MFSADSSTWILPLGELLPGFVVGRAPEIGAPREAAPPAGAQFRACRATWSSSVPRTTPVELFRACLALPLEAEPGTRAEYSDPGFILLGKALEV